MHKTPCGDADCTTCYPKAKLLKKAASAVMKARGKKK